MYSTERKDEFLYTEKLWTRVRMSLSMSMSRAFGGVLLYPAIKALLQGWQR